MFFSFKSAFLLGLVAVSAASPIANPEAAAGDVSFANHLHARAQIPAGGVTCAGTHYTHDDIEHALQQARRAQDQGGIRNGQGSTYPKTFGNKGPSAGPNSLKTKQNPDALVFPAIKKQLYEYPMGPGGVWDGHQARHSAAVVMKEDYSYVGLMVHKGGANNYVPC
ncbi:uncharacterized protein K452DRAFT_313439 [Aplosporella prunicola CBS 121167]|uniref:SCP domain-containing protein n=1 Tax=Aplosporella prunicola CBS 121167 TaxID=1176127 RepID=A0A6A6AX28_9PEZI|nr:uncharacterized protein K452DRAFT_313439 [Aplosporella prunicola CBS 121167]KAF2136156.1 hypothetical protein K452DRAFT_313439 [Aplosporella prunicola CBS 121167]